MSREILFRGKRIDNGQWVEGSLLIQSLRYGHLFSINVLYGDLDGEDCLHKVIPETIGQFTGLIDKNGNKIFEGDILLVEECDETCYTQIFWDNNLGGYADRRDFDGDSFRCYEGDMTWVKYYPIIGNIHDNPELIGKEVSDV